MCAVLTRNAALVALAHKSQRTHAFATSLQVADKLVSTVVVSATRKANGMTSHAFRVVHSYRISAHALAHVEKALGVVWANIYILTAPANHHG